jgi:hypothetical protein
LRSSAELGYYKNVGLTLHDCSGGLKLLRRFTDFMCWEPFFTGRKIADVVVT